MSHLDDLTRTFEAMSMSSIVTDIATPPPPPPPLELERWRTLSKTMNSKRSGFFTRHFDFKNEEKSRGGTGELFRFSRESSVASDISETSLKSNFSSVSRSSTLSRLFSRKKKKDREYTRSASSDSLSENWRRGWSTPATPVLPYGTWRRGRSTSATPSLSSKLKNAIEGKQRVGEFYSKNLKFKKGLTRKVFFKNAGIILSMKCQTNKSTNS